MAIARMLCPHCGEEIRVELITEVPTYKPHGPVRYDPGIEIDNFVIEAIETYRSSFSTVGQLLEQRGILTAKGSSRWYPASVRRLYEGALERRRKRESNA